MSHSRPRVTRHIVSDAQVAETVYQHELVEMDSPLAAQPAADPCCPPATGVHGIHCVTGGTHASSGSRVSVAESHKRDFWVQENKKHIPAHYRLRKTGNIINRVAGIREVDLLDVGCGPATLATVLRPTVSYYGLDIAIQDPAANLRELDILKQPIEFEDRRFGIVVAQGLFEYLSDRQSRKFAEIAGLLAPGGSFIVTYTNFGHRAGYVFEAFSNVQPIEDFRADLARYFTIDQAFPTSYNWNGGQPVRKLIQSLNMGLTANIPVIGPKLAVEYFFVCSRR
jgi:SAM-dependent methyltransferase